MGGGGARGQISRGTWEARRGGGEATRPKALGGINNLQGCAADFANLPLLALVTAALSLILLPAVNSYSRAMERQADTYALQAISSPAPFVSSMEKLAQLNLAERQPNPWIEFLFHSHPSIQKRIAFAQRFRA